MLNFNCFKFIRDWRQPKNVLRIINDLNTMLFEEGKEEEIKWEKGEKKIYRDKNGTIKQISVFFDDFFIVLDSNTKSVYIFYKEIIKSRPLTDKEFNAFKNFLRRWYE